ncbi:MAG: hypothetical protein ACI9MS_001402 [Glaciecola sp.]|jgi:hypothetical protein
MLLCITAFSCFQCVAPTKLSFEDDAQLPNISFMTFSSDGNRLTYVKTLSGGGPSLLSIKNHWLLLGINKILNNYSRVFT